MEMGYLGENRIDSGNSIAWLNEKEKDPGATWPVLYHPQTPMPTVTSSYHIHI